MPTLGSPNCSKASLQQGLTELPCPAPAKAKPDADLSHSLISKAQGLSNAALDRIMSPSLHQQNSGDYDRGKSKQQHVPIATYAQPFKLVRPSPFGIKLAAVCASGACNHNGEQSNR
eukprot:scaffold203967_cov17-Tisochrysis_lutea.AAC.1